MISPALPSESVRAELTSNPRLEREHRFANTEPVDRDGSHLDGKTDRDDDGGRQKRERNRQTAGRANVEEHQEALHGDGADECEPHAQRLAREWTVRRAEEK